MGNKKRTLLGAEYEVQDGDRASLLAQAGRNLKANAQMFATPVGRAIKKGQKLLHGVGDFLKKTQETGRTGPKFNTFGRPPGDWMIPPKDQSKYIEKDAMPDNRKSPMNHCDSEMMHSGGWGQVRKYNSPGTTGNKEAIKHNKEIMSKIGTFKMPHHSPLNKGHEVNKDSIASSKAWKAHKAEYLKKPGGQEEYDREKGEFYYSPKHGKLRLIPTDDGEVQDRTGIEKWQLAPDRKSSALHQESEAQKRRRERAEGESGETQFFYNRKPGVKEKVYNMTPDVSEEEAKAVRDKFDATYMKSSNPINFKGANSENSKCWDGYVKKGTKPSPTRPGVTVNNCVKK